MMMTNHACNFPNGIIQIIAEHTSSLSAKGSMNFPKFVTRFLARAILPSSISVRLATQNKTNAIHLFAGPPISVNIKNTKNGTMITLKTVNLFGKFIIYFSYHIIFSTLGNFNINKVSCHQFFWRIYKNTSIYLWCIHIRTSNVDIIFK